MSILSDQQHEVLFYLTRPAPCPYLAGQVEQKIFTRLIGEDAPDFLLNSRLTQHGFRRSQTMLYRPACPACMACTPLRIALKTFHPTPSLKRILRKNANLVAQAHPVEDSTILFDLFTRYQRARHAESDMAQMNEDDFRAMLREGGRNTFLLTLQKADGPPLGAMLVDRLHHGTSAVYSFFDPAEESRSLGTALILHLADWTRRNGLDYLYLGYWIKDCRKMAYKARFPALEKLGNNGWEPFLPTQTTV